jgi:demethylmenaquinone methyltransferase/2-methoxy-6-polyprenyl-1,4-benzoquinol methylase
MQRYYAERAPEYDSVYAKPERQADLRLIERWLPEVFRGRTVLEIACGTGHWTQFIAPVADGVVAIDSARETIEIAKERVAPGKVEFVIGDAYALPALGRSFSAAFAGFWHSHVPKSRVREFLRGLHARLEPGARVVLLDNRFVEGSSTPIAERDGEGNTYQLRTLQDGTTHRVLKNFPSESELRSLTEGLCSGLRYHAWQHYWAVEYAAIVAADRAGE